MKRLVRKSESDLITLYHGTRLDKFEQIMSSGALKPGQEQSIGSGGDLYLGDYYEAKTHGYGANQGIHDWDNGGPPYVVIEVRVSTDTLLPDTDDCHDCKTWEESMKRTQSCATKEPIPVSAFQKIEFIGGDNWDTIISANTGNWKQIYEQNKDILFVPGDDGWDD